jgi:hypothetical protein
MRSRTSLFALSGFALVAAALLASSPASAVQFTPTATARLHTLTSLQPGAEWNTGGLPTGGQLAYSSGAQQLSLSADLDVLNYFDPSNGSCATDVGSNCTFNYGNDPDISVVADLDSILVTNLGFGYYQIDINFASTGGTDISIVDPTDSTVLLTASWQAGTFQGNPTTGLTVSGVYDSGSLSLIGDPTAVGFGTITGGLYASLFDSGGPTDISLHLAEFFDFSPTTNAIAAAIVADYVANGGLFVNDSALISFTAEGQGQVFRVADGDFVVAEPLAGLLLVTGLGLVASRRRFA